MSLQQINLLGRATDDAKVIKSKKGKKKEFGAFTVAVNEYKGEKLGNVASFYKVLVFNKTYESVPKIKKGTPVFVTGKPGIDVYISKDKEATGNVVVYAEKWKMLD